jgi:hypothetical protein
MTMKRAMMLVACLTIGGCGQPEDPARVQLRERLKQEGQMSPQDLGRVLDEVQKTIMGQTVRFLQDGAAQPLEGEQREVVLGMLTERAGVFDEGLRDYNGVKMRIINAPGKSTNSEYETTRRLLVDIETFVPRHFEFSYPVPGMGEYAFDLVLEES